MTTAIFARWASAIIMALGGLLILAYFFRPISDLVYENSGRTLLQLGMFIFFFGCSILLSQVFGDQLEVRLQGVVFAGTLAILWGFLYLAKDFVIPPNEFSHPNFDLVVVCRIQPDFADGQPVVPLLNVVADTEKIRRIAKTANLMEDEEYAASYTHLQKPGSRSIYIKPIDRRSGEVRFSIDDLLPISSSDTMRVHLTTDTQTNDPKDFVILSAYISAEAPRRLVARINLQEAADVCRG